MVKIFFKIQEENRKVPGAAVCGSRIREPLGTQSPKPFPGTFLPENFFFLLANLDSASKVKSWVHHTHPPPPGHGNFGF